MTEIEIERAEIVEMIRHYFSTIADELWDDVETLCGRITRGEHRSSVQGQVQPDQPRGQVEPDPGIPRRH